MQQQTMANEKDSDDGWLVALEDDYVQSIGAEPDYEHQYTMERDASMRAMWTGFQESATSIAQLYRDRLSTNETGALWLPFQTAAGTVTTLYKESSDGLRRTGDAAIRSGYQRRTRELADWARKKNRRYIRREELLAYLAGKPPPPLHGAKPERPASGSHHHPHHHPGQPPLGHHLHHHSYGGAHNNTSSHTHLHGSHHHHHHHHHHTTTMSALHTHGSSGGGGGGNHTLLSSSSSTSSPAAVAYLSKAGLGCVGDDDGLQQQQQPLQLLHEEGTDGEQLHTFKEALARRPRAPDLYAFVTDEIARHSKRPASPLDINMDAQQNIGGKRTRFL